MLTQKFWDKVDKTGNCWEWIASKDRHGYGQIRLNYKLQYAHRVSYEDVYGKIPLGLVIDHLCKTPACINPDHLESVSQRENCKRGKCGIINRNRNLAKTHCKYGHKFTIKNTYRYSDNRRSCKICRKALAKRQYERKTKLQA